MSEMKKRAELVMVPAPAAGHYISAVEFAKRLIHTDDRFSVTVLRIPFSLSPRLYNNSLVASETHLRFVDLPAVVEPPLHLFFQSIEHYMLLLIQSYVPHIKHAITGLLSSSSSLLAGFLLDFFCLSVIDVAHHFRLPSYIYFTSSAAFLGLVLHLPTRHAQLGAEFRDSDPDLVLPSLVNPAPSRVLPEAVSNKLGGYDAYIKIAQRFRDVQGIIVNTFAELEPYAIESFADDGRTPPVYTVGPVIDLGGQAHPDSDRSEHGEIMDWLDAQPEASVVFLCFGSMGSFGRAQVKEIALGLERSGQRFLWALRLPGLDGKFGGSSDPAKHADVLPEGFIDRTRDRGMMCGWAPQMEVLAHKAIGGFMSHCGWNSILESLWNGVPIATWPMYAEQQLNAFEMVKELGLAVELRVDYRKSEGGVVMAEEIEGAVRGLMEGDGSVRKKIKEMGEMSRRAVMDGGSSSISISRLIDDIIHRTTQPH